MNNADWLILNIDDEQAIRYAKTRALQRAGFRVIEAASGKEGLDAVDDLRPDLVMCDVKMPDISGLEVCRRIKERHPRTLVLQCSASFVTPMDRVIGLDLGADSYLTEPVEPQELIAAVRALLRMKKAEDDLRALNERLEAEVAQRTLERDRIWTVSSELMAVIGRDGYAKSINPAWSRMLGLDEAIILSRPFVDLVHPDDRVTAAIVGSIGNSTADVQFEARLVCNDGSDRWIAWTMTPDENVAYALGRDVTDDKRRMAELEAAQAQLRQSQKMEAVGQLTGGIAHDFNNLLTGIIGSLDILRRRIAHRRLDDVERFMDAAVASANRAAALTHRLLAFSRRQSLDFKPIDIAALIESVRDLLQRTIGENITLRFALDFNLWPANTDANQLETALLNLVINSRDAMPQGGEITIAASNVAFTDSSEARREGLEVGAYIAVSVRDTGTGMPLEVLDKAFDPFFTTKPIGQGTGLGLSMIYGFAKQSGGHVRIDSEPGKGTTVVLFLPRHYGDTPSAENTRAVRAQSARSGEVVLLVEDDPSVRILVTEVLRDLGYETLLARDGREAADLLSSQQRIDLLITDVGLPGMNGREVAEIGRRTRPHLKVLFMTGYAEEAADRAQFLAQGMDMIVKPFDLASLAAKVRSSIEH